MELFERAQNLLAEGGFEIRPSGSSEGFAFEDANVFGFVRIATSVESLITGWEGHQESFIRRNMSMAARVPEKAWNAYAVFLTSDDCPPHLRSHLIAIEEDFRGARKIARAGVLTREATEQALAPLLRVRHIVRLEAADLDARIEQDPAIPPLLRSLLVTGAPPDRIASALLEEE